MAKASPRRPMTLMVISPFAERIHMALMMGATAAAMGQPTTFFFSKGAVKFLQNEEWANLQTSEGVPSTDMDAKLDTVGVADTALLLDGLSALNVRFVACESALRENDIEAFDLIKRPAVEVSGLADILEKGSGGDWLTF